MEKLIIDRFEGKYAVCEKENKHFKTILKTELPREAKEGDVIIFDKKKMTIDEESTKKRKMQLAKKLNNLFE